MQAISTDITQDPRAAGIVARDKPADGAFCYSLATTGVYRRPVRGTRGAYRVKPRHGVSQITRGQRHPLGIIVHDAT